MEDNQQKPEKSDGWKDFLGEFALQFLFTLMFAGAGGAYFAFGFGAIFLIFPYAALLYFLYKKYIGNSTKQQDKEPSNPQVKNDEAV